MTDKMFLTTTKLFLGPLSASERSKKAETNKSELWNHLSCGGCQEGGAACGHYKQGNELCQGED